MEFKCKIKFILGIYWNGLFENLGKIFKIAKSQEMKKLEKLLIFKIKFYSLWKQNRFSDSDI